MSPSSLDRWTGRGLGLVAGVTGGIVFLIVGFIALSSAPAFREVGIGSMLTDERWLPASHREPGYGVLPMLAATGLLTVLSTALALPLGVGCGIFIRFHSSRWLGNWQRRVLELLAGVPSVVLGFWGLTTLVPMIARIQPPGQSLLAGVVILTIMIVPTVALTSLAALTAVPAAYLSSAAALGLSRYRTIIEVALPAARPGILAGALLAAARAVGETMAVVMVCGNLAQFPHSLFDPVRPVTSTIALEMGYATASHRSVLFALALLLILLIGGATGMLALARQKRSPAQR